MGSGKLALVTGASGGIGLEFAKLLAAAGYDLALVARSGEKLAELAAALEKAHGIAAQPIAMSLDVPSAADELFARVPRCDVLINNAGFANHGRFDRIPEERVREEVMLDVVTLTELTRKYLPGMIDRRAGKILNVASTAGFLPGPFMAVYYAAKAYVISFSEALWEELRGTGVTLTCLAPGATATGFADRAGLGKTLLFRFPQSTAAAVALQGYRAMQRGERVCVARPATNWMVPIATRFAPRRLLLRISRKLVET